MKEKTLSILERVKNGELSINLAQEELFSLFKFDGFKKDFEIGDQVRIVKRIKGHNFEIGEVVTIIDKNDRGVFDCKNNLGKKWFVVDDEVELFN